MDYLGFINKELILFTSVYVVVVLVINSIWLHPKGLAPWKRKLRRRRKALKEWWQKNISSLWAKASILNKTYIIVALIVFVPLILLFVIFYFQISLFLIGKGTTETRELAFAFFGTISGLAGLFGVYLAILRSETNERQTYTAEEGLITDRINKATEGLGKNNEKGNPLVEVRLGALYALERIAQDSFRDHVQIMEILCAYVRHNSPLQDEIDEIKQLREDIKTAIAIIGRRWGWPDGEKRIEHEKDKGYRLDLRNCDLQGAELHEANLGRAKFYKANLSRAQLYKADLNRAGLRNANLNRAQLDKANLDYTILAGANLSGARIRSATLVGTRLMNANLSGASLNFINLEDAKTDKAYAYHGGFLEYQKFTQNQLDDVFFGIKVTSPDGWKRPKHWPKDDLSLEEFETVYREWRKTGHWESSQRSFPFIVKPPLPKP